MLSKFQHITILIQCKFIRKLISNWILGTDDVRPANDDRLKNKTSEYTYKNHYTPIHIDENMDVTNPLFTIDTRYIKVRRICDDHFKGYKYKI